jgi:hypothetical protein
MGSARGFGANIVSNVGARVGFGVGPPWNHAHPACKSVVVPLYSLTGKNQDAWPLSASTVDAVGPTRWFSIMLRMDAGSANDSCSGIHFLKILTIVICKQ